jgi:hypothetical protein
MGSPDNETRAVIDRAYRLRSGIVEALYEPVNECEAGNSPPDTGGVVAPSRKRCEATAAAQTGWSGLPKCFGMRSLEGVPFLTGCALASACAPLSGGEWRAQFIHTFHERPLAFRCAKIAEGK